MNKIIDVLRKHRVLRKLFLQGYRLISPVNQANYDNRLHKRKSKMIFADTVLPIGAVRARILQGLGLPISELKGKPFVGICSTYSESSREHGELRNFVERAKSGVWASGGVPFEFCVPGFNDADGKSGFNGVNRKIEENLFSRWKLLADTIECYVRSQWFDGILTVCSNEAVPAMLMACARLNLPSFCVTAGFSSEDGVIKEEDRFSLLLETFGISLPNSTCMPVFASEKQTLAFKAGQRIYDMIKKNTLITALLSSQAFENAAAVWAALGGAEETLSVLLLIAEEAGLDLNEETLRKAFNKTSVLCPLRPHGPFTLQQLYVAGGIPAVMKQLENKLYLNTPTCTGKTLGSLLRKYVVKAPGMFQSKADSYPLTFSHQPSTGNGQSSSHLSRPVIAVANSWVELTPGHVHLRTIGEYVKAGIREAGGTPVEFNVPAPCDGVGNGNDGMKYILAQRDLIARLVETYVRAHRFDGLVTISSCDKINPGMLMAAAKLNLPTICVPGGSSAFQIRYLPGMKSVNHQDYDSIDQKLATATCATCGACEIMGTANTFQCLMEVLGMALPGSGGVPAYDKGKLHFSKEAGKRIVEMVKVGLCPSRILTREAFENAVMADMAISGSTNTTLHLPAIAHSAGKELPLSLFNDFSGKIPTLCGITPNGPYGMKDFFEAGGVPAVLKQLSEDLHLDCLTVTGKTWREELEKFTVKNPLVISSKSQPVRKEGGTAVLFGNLAPQGAVIKQSAVSPSMKKFQGKAQVFNSEQEALHAFMKEQIQEGTVVVIRYEGPKGSPGMPELLSVTALMDVLGLERVALVTDGRFSGATAGPCVGHVTPEAYDGGAIAALKDGDEILIDIPNRKLEVNLSDEELKGRLENFTPLEKPLPKSYMSYYRKEVSTAARGAVIEKPAAMRQVASRQ